MYTVRWKHEDTINGEPVGPVSVTVEDPIPDPSQFGVPYTSEPVTWVTLREAQAIAASHSVTLQEG